MNEEMKAALQAEFAAFKNSLPSFQTKADAEKAFADFKADTEKKFEGLTTKEDFEKLENSMKAQGETLQSLKVHGESKVKSFGDLLKENKAAFDTMIAKGGEGKIEIKTSYKAIQESSVGSDTGAYRDATVGQIHRGMPFMRDLFPTVRLGSDSHNTVRWYEQLAVTNNATNVAEVRTVGSESVLTWVEKSLAGKRIFDWFKISVDSLKDINFILGEVTAFINKNMRLKENTQLISGLGTGNEIKGIQTYATAFDTNITKISMANLHDLVGKIRTQITNATYGGATPNYALTNAADVDTLRYTKTTEGSYVFPQLSFGETARLGNVPTIENALMTADTLLVGDFSLATLYVWDDVVVEIAQIEDDKKTGLTTVMCYLRENLRVRDVDAAAFVKVASIATDLAAITAPVN